MLADVPHDANVVDVCEVFLQVARFFETLATALAPMFPHAPVLFVPFGGDFVPRGRAAFGFDGGDVQGV